jgi:feruloyl-CoA synthase
LSGGSDFLHDLATAPLRPVKLWQPDLTVDRRPDGTILISQKEPLGAYARAFTEPFARIAAADPERIYLRDRHAGEDWRELSYGAAMGMIRSLGQALLDLGLSAERPLVILSENSQEHALLALAALHVGVAYAPISTAYSLISKDFGKLKDIAALLTPGLVFAADGRRYGPALQAAFAGVPLVVAHDPPDGRAILFADLLRTVPGPAVEAAHRAVGPDTIAKFLFTSGSTGSPKAVINTQRMMCSNQEMLRDCLRYITEEPPVLMDWAPWNHTAGGNVNFGLVAYNGGTFHVDDGKPTPGEIHKTVRNLRTAQPTWYFNVPKGYDMLLPHLEADEHLRRHFFEKLKVLFYAGAGLAQHTFEAYNRLSLKTTGERIPFLTSLGSTETGPFATGNTSELLRVGNIGIPGRGVTLKLVPMEGKLDARFKGPNITPGYWRNPEITRTAFDAEGFYCMGDAVRFADPDQPAKGLFFDGRTAENFKLETGIWVAVGALRSAFINHFGPIVRDVVIAGLNRPYLGALVIPDPDLCRQEAGLDAEAPLDSVLAHEKVRALFQRQLDAFARDSTGSSTLIRRIILLSEPLSLDRGEVTDKGSVNQRAVLNHRGDLVDALYEHSPRVISLSEKQRGSP